MRNVRQFLRVILVVAVVTITGANLAFAQTSSSPSYKMVESDFGAVDNKQNCSGSYCARVSLGSGDFYKSMSANGTLFSPLLSTDPVLEMITTPDTEDLGELATSKTSTKTMIIKVRSYLSDGYTLQIVGTAPKYGSHTLNTPATPENSQVGKEQFGINLVANTSPNIGSNPLQVPSDQISFGVVSDDYKTANKFMYRSGDMVASSSVATGQTEYKLSIIVNISSNTPAGDYKGNYSAVVTSKF